MQTEREAARLLGGVALDGKAEDALALCRHAETI